MRRRKMQPSRPKALYTPRRSRSSGAGVLLLRFLSKATGGRHNVLPQLDYEVRSNWTPLHLPVLACALPLLGHPATPARRGSFQPARG